MTINTSANDWLLVSKLTSPLELVTSSAIFRTIDKRYPLRHIVPTEHGVLFKISKRKTYLLRYSSTHTNNTYLTRRLCER